jgi:hypothetical protein
VLKQALDIAGYAAGLAGDALLQLIGLVALVKERVPGGKTDPSEAYESGNEEEILAPA